MILAQSGKYAAARGRVALVCIGLASMGGGWKLRLVDLRVLVRNGMRIVGSASWSYRAEDE